MAECPVCAARVEVASDVITGEILVCEDCGAELEVKDISPVELAEAPAAEEDWGE